MTVFLKKIKNISNYTIHLPASKSESNRALIISKLAGNGGYLKNLSEARDTQTMIHLLNFSEKTLDVLDAGTTMRFLTAFYAIKGENKILTGSKRMQDRPIGILVEALKELGAGIIYLNREGFPPIEINGFRWSGIKEIRVKGDISSQYISALLMISPLLPEGLTLHLTGKVGSKPYIHMTLGIMKHFEVNATWEGNSIIIPSQTYKSNIFMVSPDWSAASYWYSLAAVTDSGEISLWGLERESFQGDRIIADIMDSMGVHTEFHNNGITLSRKKCKEEIRFDFSDCPDLAQTVAVTAALKGIKYHLTGLESLRIKETDRIAALQNELRKFNSNLVESSPGTWTVLPVKDPNGIPGHVKINTYDDHRMAMAFAPLVAFCDLEIENPQVVKKSYPGFWEDLARAGIDIKFSQ